MKIYLENRNKIIDTDDRWIHVITIEKQTQFAELVFLPGEQEKVVRKLCRAISKEFECPVRLTGREANGHIQDIIIEEFNR